MKKTAIQRGQYGEIQTKDIPDVTRKMLKNLLNGVLNAAKVDEHGGRVWSFAKPTID